jgi:hypothetical protein
MLPNVKITMPSKKFSAYEKGQKLNIALHMQGIRHQHLSFSQP